MRPCSRHEVGCSTAAAVPKTLLRRMMTMTAGTHRTGWTLTLLLTCLAVSLICVVYPIYVVRPFRAQGERELAAALVVMRFRPVVTVISALCALLAAVGYWRAQPRKWRRILAIGGAL